MTAEVHCPECGTFLEKLAHGQQKRCPRCGNEQAIILPAAEPEKFGWEKRREQREKEERDLFSASILRGLNR